jgi:hypothetical protein
MNTGLWNMDSGLAAPLGARVRAPVGWRIFDAPGCPGVTTKWSIETPSFTAP